MQRAPVDAQSLMAKMLEQAPGFTLRRRPFLKFFMLNDAAHHNIPGKVLPKPETVSFVHTETLAPLSASFLSPKLPYFQGGSLRVSESFVPKQDTLVTAVWLCRQGSRVFDPWQNGSTRV